MTTSGVTYHAPHAEIRSRLALLGDADKRRGGPFEMIPIRDIAFT
jgi:hypothetical protein